MIFDCFGVYFVEEQLDKATYRKLFWDETLRISCQPRKSGIREFIIRNVSFIMKQRFDNNFKFGSKTFEPNTRVENTSFILIISIRNQRFTYKSQFFVNCSRNWNKLIDSWPSLFGRLRVITARLEPAPLWMLCFQNFSYAYKRICSICFSS